MKIYTKIGDKGTTKLGNGTRVSKDEVIVCTLGSIDELNSILGVIEAEKHSDIICKIQSDLFSIGSELCLSKYKYESIDKDIELLENQIDALDSQMKPLKNFILPGGNKLSAWYHHARTVCRRAEREVVSYSKTMVMNPKIIIYLNRLSDLLFVIARYENNRGEQDIIWRG